MFDQLHMVWESFDDLGDVMPEIAEIIDSSVQENFQVGGRFGTDNELGGGSEHWDQSQRAKRQNGKTLVDTARMRGSFEVHSQRDSITIGSNVAYAAIHHFGGTIKHPGGTPYLPIDGIPTFLRKTGKYRPGTRFTKAHDIPMPARPWAVIQNEDLENINEAVVRFLRRRVG